MEIAELILSCISTAVAVFSFVYAFFAKKESKALKQELNYIIENNPNLKISCSSQIKTKTSTKVNGNNNMTAGGDINVQK